MKRNNKLLFTALAGLGATLAARTLWSRNRYDFRRRVAVITGGSRGLGLVLARELAGEGARLALLARDEDELARARQQLLELGADVVIFPCDVRDQAQVQATIEEIISTYGRIDVLINNAGVIQGGPIEHMTIADFEEAMAVHTWGPLYAILAALPHMRRQGGGRIVNIASIGGKVAVPHLVPYCTSKFALVGLSDGLRAELAKDNITVTTVCPGLMRTGSHFNALIKGQHQAEFTWFSILDTLPVTSISARRAARQIIEACRDGQAELIITIQARLLARFSQLFPELTARGMVLANRILPDPTGVQGDEPKTGWESQSYLAPSLLTRLGDRVVDDNNQVPDPLPVNTPAERTMIER